MALEKEALYYRKEDDSLRCLLCPHGCLIKDGRVGICRVRENKGGRLIALTYGRVTSAGLDPVEKKPLYHFKPGSMILSVGTLGCNFKCAFCQNWSISQCPPAEDAEEVIKAGTKILMPDDLVKAAADTAGEGNIGIAYTYNEPSIWFEYVLECSKKSVEKGLDNVLVTNGYINREPLKELLPYISAMNVDLKSIKDEFYRKLCGGRVGPVLETLKTVNGKVELEITNLLITGENDSEEDIKGLVDWVADNLGADVPVHFSRYRPDFRFDAPPTPAGSLETAYRIAREKLKYVYIGNMPGHPGDNTYCPGCNEPVMTRYGFTLSDYAIDGEGRCRHCGEPINLKGPGRPHKAFFI
ncbi:MAG: AmmeMemoRadiSam system radical SAM enzyme [Chloroflexi bacterium]|nr:AmmeMemoRadiSam system radical SAM enzyme [Chloroflexota bacterium]